MEVFQNMFKRYVNQLPIDFLKITTEVFKKMQNGTMCPAPQLSIGANCTASVMVTQAVRILSNQSVKVVPESSIINLLDAVA